MAKYEQAPLLKHSGKKEQYINSKNGTFYKYSPDLFAAIMNCLDSRDTVSIKIMLFLAGNGGDANFRIASKTICERCNVSERRYVSSRQKLVDMGWLRHKEGDYIEVCFDAIYNDYRKLLSQRDDITSCQRDDITSYEKISYTDITSCQRDDVKTLDGMTLRHEMGCHYVMDNKINNNINNNIKIEKDVSYAAQSAAPPAASGGEFFQKMKEVEKGSVRKSLYELRQQMDNEWKNQKCKQDALLLVDEWWNAVIAQLIDWYGAEYQESGHYSDKIEYRKQITDKINNYAFSR